MNKMPISKLWVDGLREKGEGEGLIDLWGFGHLKKALEIVISVQMSHFPIF